MILVTGAAGKTGRAVIQALAERKVPVRAWVFREEQRELVQAQGATEALVGDLRDPGTWPRALDGVEAVYLIFPNLHPDEQAMGELALEQMVRAQIPRVVYHSVLHPQTEEMPHHWRKLRVEEALFRSGLGFTVLQPCAYMQNLLPYLDRVLREGIYAVPYGPRARISMVDLEDVAQVAAQVLTESGHLGAIYELAGPEPLSPEDVARHISAVLGKPVKAWELSLVDWELGARQAGLTNQAAATLKAMFRYYNAYGLWGNPNVLGWLLQREPTSLRAFLHRELSGG